MTLYKEKELCDQFETDFFSLRPPGLPMWLAQRTSNQHASLCASLHTACCGKSRVMTMHRPHLALAGLNEDTGLE